MYRPEFPGGLEARLSVEDLASHVSMSVRNFERVFTREVGTAPSQYVLQARVEAARRCLERTDMSPKQVASTTGFASADAMRRAFIRLLGITPRRYRDLAVRPVAPPARRQLSRAVRGDAGALPYGARSRQNTRGSPVAIGQAAIIAGNA